ncbi:MAG: small multi-drug export protein, partial [Pygmaiobacter sp.]
MVASALSNGGRVAKAVYIMLISMAPMIENKASMLVAAALHVKWSIAYLCTSVGCFLPTPFLLTRGDKLLKKLRRYPVVNAAMAKVDHFVQTHPKFLKKNAYRSLFFVIAIPFTGIGIWAGCALSNLLGLEKHRSMRAILAAIVVSGLITVFTS